MPIVFHRPIPKGFKVKTGTVIPEAEGWYISLTLENQTVPVTVAEIQPTAENSLGIDLAITHCAYLSNGERVKNPKFLRTSAEKLARLQAKLAKRVISNPPFIVLYSSLCSRTLRSLRTLRFNHFNATGIDIKGSKFWKSFTE